MRKLPTTDPTSWAYQANIHGTFDPQPWPAQAPWATCPHHEVLFIAWHRIYLRLFESMIAAKSGMANFALPYWDYSKADHRALPAPFRETDPAAAFFPLYEPDRVATYNNGGSLPAGLTDPSAALAVPDYLGVWGFQESVENLPHDEIHGQIGGKMGWIEKAAQDPIFWLHHCNIDRLQERWFKDYTGHNLSTAGADPNWTNPTFRLARADGSLASYRAYDSISTMELGYIYDQDYTSDFFQRCTKGVPILGPLSARSRSRADGLKELRAGVELRRQDIDLARESEVSVPIGPVTLEKLARTAADTRVLLILDGVSAAVPPEVTFTVHIGSAERPSGFVSFFGRLRNGDSRGAMPGHQGQRPIVIDITDRLGDPALRALIASRKAVPVRFSPISAEMPGRPSAAARPAPGSAPLIGAAEIVVVDNLPARS